MASGLDLGVAGCFGFERAFGLDSMRGLALLFGRAAAFGFRFAAEVRFFILLGLLDLDLLPERFPAMNEPPLGDEANRFSEAA
ncbi:MAG TPA: hypothetical protein VEU09_02995 [Candidatus Binatia bacterium]|nr:hypothetical protein [Candidatus Binatia bacterium]